MRRLAAIEFLTVDGVMQGLGSPDEDTEGGFTHGGWGARYAPAIQGPSGEEGLGATTAYLFGRKTYEKMAAFWPFQPAENPIAAHLNATPKYVATRTLATLEWAGSQVLDGELGAAVSDLKSDGDGTVAVLGSGVLVHELMTRDLVDELRLFVHPLLLGTGKRLFRELPAPRELQLMDSSTTSMGTLVLRYSVQR
ncbi:MAG TPA: dihydrofolate reductase family protein [Jiangellales bacterium]|nr:dihydrofolate reductase family protein [Jiangellales bacterium]